MSIERKKLGKVRIHVSKQFNPPILFFLQVVKQSNNVCFGPKRLGTFVLYYPKKNICVEEN
jgi:hypothetical protein